MKMLILEQDIDLANSIKEYLCSTRVRFDIKIIQNEEDFFEDLEFLLSCSIFVLNLKNPKDTKIRDFIKENVREAPILLVLEKDAHGSIFKELYYLSYDNVIVKDFLPEEIAFYIYKLCDLWNNNVFLISNDVYFNYKIQSFYNKEKTIHLGKKEAKLLKLLCIRSPGTVSFRDINYYVYIDDMINEEKVRSLVRELRKKISMDLIKTKKGEGYHISQKINSLDVED
ncbi:MAG: winged helix-turn-helix domain-containing protein [Arcobacter sp.]|nr:winged helix-turn-helix domain-containing protein [Arcobacter sp.]